MRRSVESAAFRGRYAENENMSKFFLNIENMLANKNSKEYKRFWKNHRVPGSITQIRVMFEQMLKNNDIRHYETDGTQVILDLHTMQRADERAWFMDVEAFVKGQLQGDVLDEVLVNDVVWDETLDKTVPANPDSYITATAVVKEGDALIPVYEAGSLAINVRTMLEKRLDWFLPETRVLFVDKNNNILGETIITKKGAADVSPEISAIVLR